MMFIMKRFESVAPRESRRRPRTRRRQASPFMESLETREMLSGVDTSLTTVPAALWTPASTNLADAQNGPMANLGTNLVSIYQSYAADVAAQPRAAGSVAAGLATKFPSVEFENGLVGMDINSLGGNFSQYVNQLTSLGMVVTATSSDYGIVEGWVPVAALPTIARLPQTEAGSPIHAPIRHVASAFQGYQGTAYNQAETALAADAARSQYGLTGAGVTIGVISDSVSQVGGGLADSYATGDLLANQVTVLADSAGGSDEGRAMMESIHDIAPGANLQFSAAGNGDLAFMQSIKNLYNAGSKVIVDDISQSDEPFFQDGLIAQGIDYVTARGDSYFTSAANSGAQSGYLSSFRPVTATVHGITGTWQNFNGGTGPAGELLQVTTGSANAPINFQFDQPFKTQEPVGATAAPTSSMSFYVYNASGTIVASGTDNNVATQQPYQFVTIPNPGTYYVAIRLVSGTAPGHVEFVGVGNAGATTISQVYGAAGGTYYPSSEGHETTAAAIGVGATPWWAPGPFVSQSPLANESSSSTGPGLIDLSPKGTPIVPQLVQDPAITGPDGGTTSFFGQGGIDTTLYSPNSSFNFVPTNQQNLKSFFGTSQAAPNVAAVVALMLQEVPTLSRVQILKALETTARPMNGTPAGTWNVQSGYGLVNALAAIKSIAPSALASTSVTVTPSVTTPTVGQPFNITAAAAGSGGTPAGGVDFYDISYNTDLGSIPLSAGMASLTTTPTVAGAHVYLVTYSGDSTHARNTAYLVIDVLAAGSVGHSLFSTSGGNPLIANSRGVGTNAPSGLLFIDVTSSTAASELTDGTAVIIVSITTVDSNHVVKKHTM